MTTRFEAAPFGTRGLFHIVRHDNKGKHYLAAFGEGRRLFQCTQSAAASIVSTLEHGRDNYRESRWITEETVYQGGHQYPSMFAAAIAK